MEKNVFKEDKKLVRLGDWNILKEKLCCLYLRTGAVKFRQKEYES